VGGKEGLGGGVSGGGRSRLSAVTSPVAVAAAAAVATTAVADGLD